MERWLWIDWGGLPSEQSSCRWRERIESMAVGAEASVRDEWRRRWIGARGASVSVAKAAAT